MPEHDQPIGDEMLNRIMQYCDGVLDARESEIVAREIAADPTLQALARDLTYGATAAREALAPLINRPVPLALARSITKARSTSPKPFSQAFHQIAAALIGLLVGAGAISLWSQHDNQNTLRLAGADSQPDDTFTSEVRSALISALSAEPALVTRPYQLPNEAGDHGSVSVIRWFDLATGVHCAEFRQDQVGEGQATDIVASGVVCRRSDGGWELIALPTRSN